MVEVYYIYGSYYSDNMYAIMSVLWLAESMSIYPKQCQNVKLRVKLTEQKFEIKNETVF